MSRVHVARLLAWQLSERHLGRWAVINANRRKPGVAGTLTAVFHSTGHSEPGQPYLQSGYVRVTIGGDVRAVPWYKLVKVTTTRPKVGA